MRITKLKDLDGLSIKDTARMPHPCDLAKWEGRYTIDAERGIFRVKEPAIPMRSMRDLDKLMGW